MCLLMVYAHTYLATKNMSKYTFVDNYDTKFIILKDHIITLVLQILYLRQV